MRIEEFIKNEMRIMKNEKNENKNEDDKDT